jgi:hypothetical protein
VDLRTGERYPTLEAALSAGVPVSDVAEVTEREDDVPLVRVTAGPFKGRVYRRTTRGNLVRVRGAVERRTVAR